MQISWYIVLKLKIITNAPPLLQINNGKDVFDSPFQIPRRNCTQVTPRPGQGIM